MSCHVFFPPPRFNMLSFIENCRETWDINQAINSRDYANEVTGVIVSQNSFSPGRLQWTLPTQPTQRLDQEPSCPCSSPLKRAPSRSAQAQGGFFHPDRQPRPAASWKTAEETENVWATNKGEMWGPWAGLRVLLWQGLLLLWRKLKEMDIHKLKNFPNRIHHKLRWQVGTKASTMSTPMEENQNHDWCRR